MGCGNDLCDVLSWWQVSVVQVMPKASVGIGDCIHGTVDIQPAQPAGNRCDEFAIHVQIQLFHGLLRVPQPACNRQRATCEGVIVLAKGDQALLADVLGRCRNGIKRWVVQSGLLFQLPHILVLGLQPAPKACNGIRTVVCDLDGLVGAHAVLEVREHVVQFARQRVGDDALLHRLREFQDFFCDVLKCLEAVLVDRNCRIGR